MGEPLARAELFIFFVTLVQKIKFEAVEGSEPDPQRFTAGLTRSPDEFIVKSKQRFNKDD